ncbi:NifB/NifX family molybdenum-iron cluster-binding protein [Vibrio taketomensis]|uniref:NifB/NifX family molybdenum-iron cluster-binding protein n=1 Tax=Vibrio taketomensis TaxID=2572923 RepID=UPI0013893DDA|nr:NifB/NifX family molybdenum-iron cluster-binding protein [Vibrio taketomensis]
MIYAIPSQNFAVANHFSRSPHVVIVDDQAQTRHLIAFEETPSTCGRKKQWMQILQSHKVEAVVVRSIGKKMLQRLFDHNLKVLMSPPKAQIEELDFSQLDVVTSIEYGREPRKQGGCCGHKKSATKPSLLSSPLSARFAAIKRIMK